VLHCFVLARVAVAIEEEVERFLGKLVCVDHSIGVIRSSCAVGRALGIGASYSAEVGVEDLHGFLFVAHVNHAETCRGRETVPVGGLTGPLQVVSEEGVVSSVRVHDSILPNCGGMEHRRASPTGSDGVFGVVDQDHVSVVVLFKELQIQSGDNLAVQN